MSEKQSYRDKDDMPTERAVLEREWKAMRLALSTPRAALATQPGSVGGPVAWLNFPVKTDELGNFAGCAEPRLSFKRESYGFDYNNAVPLGRLAAAPTEAKPATQPICEGCGKTIPEHDALLRCKAEATQQASGEREALTEEDVCALQYCEHVLYEIELGRALRSDEAHVKDYRAATITDAKRMAAAARKRIGPVFTRIIRAALSTPAQQDAVDADMVLRAARELCRIHAGECQVNEQDTWNLYAEQFKRDADAVVRAAISAKKGQP